MTMMTYDKINNMYTDTASMISPTIFSKLCSEGGPQVYIQVMCLDNQVYLLPETLTTAASA